MALHNTACTEHSPKKSGPLKVAITTSFGAAGRRNEIRTLTYISGSKRTEAFQEVYYLLLHPLPCGKPPLAGVIEYHTKTNAYKPIAAEKSDKIMTGTESKNDKFALLKTMCCRFSCFPSPPPALASVHRRDALFRGTVFFPVHGFYGRPFLKWNLHLYAKYVGNGGTRSTTWPDRILILWFSFSLAQRDGGREKGPSTTLGM